LARFLQEKNGLSYVKKVWHTSCNIAKLMPKTEIENDSQNDRAKKMRTILKMKWFFWQTPKT